MEGEGPLFASLTEGQALFWRSALRIRAAVRLNTIVGTFRSNDVDGNESVKKKNGLISKTATSQVNHDFLYMSFLFLHDYDLKMPNFAFYGGCKQATTKFYFILFFFSELGYGHLKFSFRRVRLHLTK